MRIVGALNHVTRPTPTLIVGALMSMPARLAAPDVRTRPPSFRTRPPSFTLVEVIQIYALEDNPPCRWSVQAVPVSATVRDSGLFPWQFLRRSQTPTGTKLGLRWRGSAWCVPDESCQPRRISFPEALAPLGRHHRCLKNKPSSARVQELAGPPPPNEPRDIFDPTFTDAPDWFSKSTVWRLN